MVDFLIVLRAQNETHHKNIKHAKLFWKEILDAGGQNYKTMSNKIIKQMWHFGNVRIFLSAKI